MDGLDGNPGTDGAPGADGDPGSPVSIFVLEQSVS